MSDLSKAINKLRALSPQLNAAVIEADRVVAMVERFLVEECGLGVEAEVPLQFNDKGKVVAMLRFGSVNGNFRITVTHTDGSTHFVSRPWTECDRNQRLVSFVALPKLLIAVAKAVEHQIASTTQTATTVGQIISALGASARLSPESASDFDPRYTTSGLALLVDSAEEGVGNGELEFESEEPIGVTEGDSVEAAAPEAPLAANSRGRSSNGQAKAGNGEAT